LRDDEHQNHAGLLTSDGFKTFPNQTFQVGATHAHTVLLDVMVDSHNDTITKEAPDVSARVVLAPGSLNFDQSGVIAVSAAGP